MEITYGIISDIHEADPRLVVAAFAVLKNLGAQKLILNGDLIGDRFPQLNAQEYATIVLQAAAKTGLEVFAQGGSHEEITSFEPVLKAASSHFGNLHDVSDSPKVEADDHHLIFLPGSDWSPVNPAHGLYLLSRSEKDKTGFYETETGPIRLTNLNDVLKYTTQPEKTIVVCHVPRRFDSIKTGVDMAYFAEKADKSIMPGVVLETMICRQLHRTRETISQEEFQRIAVQNGYTFKRENRGNIDLRDVYQEAGITKTVSGHFHESAHRAHDEMGKPIPEGKFENELHWMASYLDERKVGLLNVRDGAVAYRNVDLRNYLYKGFSSNKNSIEAFQKKN